MYRLIQIGDIKMIDNDTTINSLNEIIRELDIIVLRISLEEFQSHSSDDSIRVKAKKNIIHTLCNIIKDNI